MYYTLKVSDPNCQFDLTPTGITPIGITSMTGEWQFVHGMYPSTLLEDIYRLSTTSPTQGHALAHLLRQGGPLYNHLVELMGKLLCDTRGQPLEPSQAQQQVAGIFDQLHRMSGPKAQQPQSYAEALSFAFQKWLSQWNDEVSEHALKQSTTFKIKECEGTSRDDTTIGSLCSKVGKCQVCLAETEFDRITGKKSDVNAEAEVFAGSQGSLDVPLSATLFGDTSGYSVNEGPSWYRSSHAIQSPASQSPAGIPPQNQNQRPALLSKAPKKELSEDAARVFASLKKKKDPLTLNARTQMTSSEGMKVLLNIHNAHSAVFGDEPIEQTVE